MALNEQQQKFCEIYARTGDATKAAIEAGYSKKTAHVYGPKLTTNPEVAKFLAMASKSAAERLGITHEWLLQSFRENYERCTELVPVRDRKGEQVYIDGPGGERVAAYTLYDAKAAKGFGEMIAKHLKMFSDKPQESDEDELPRFEPLNTEDAAQQYLEMVKATS